MADKTIGQLQAASQVTPTDLFVLEQSGVAKKLTGQTLENWLLTFADGHGGIQSIAKTSTSGLTDTYTITLSDNTTVTFTVRNGKGISSVTTYYAVSTSGSTVPSSWSTTRQTMTATNKYLWSYQHIAFNDNTSVDTVKTVIGVYGDKGDQGNTGNTGNGISSLAQTGRVAGEYTIYTFTMTNGTTQSFNAYDGVGISSINTYYAVSSNGTTPPTSWSESRQNMTATDRYLWSYQVINLSNNTTIQTQKIVIGVYGDKGDKGDKGDPGEVTQAEFDDLKSAFEINSDLRFASWAPGIRNCNVIGDVIGDVVYASASYVHSILPCTESDIVTVNVRGANAARAWAYLDAEYKVLQCGESNTLYANTVLPNPPKNTAYVLLNNRTAAQYLPDGYYGFVGSNLVKTRLSALESGVSNAISMLNGGQVHPWLKTNDDLNDYTNIGQYTIPSAAVAWTLKNLPAAYQGTGSLTVLSTHNENHVYQILLSNQSTAIWSRHIRIDSRIFDNWETLVGESKTWESKDFLIHNPMEEYSVMLNVIAERLGITLENTTDYVSDNTQGERNISSENIYQLWDSLHNDYPQYVDAGEIIGYSLDPDGNNYAPVKAYYIHPRLSYVDYNGVTQQIAYTQMPTIYITAGTHGGESTPTWVLFEIFRRALLTGTIYSDFLDGLTFRVVPCLDRWCYDNHERFLAAAYNSDGTVREEAIDPATGEINEIYNANRQCICSDMSNPSYNTLTIREFATEAKALTDYLQNHNFSAVNGDCYIDLHNCSYSLGYLTTDTPRFAHMYNTMVDSLSKDWHNNTTWANGDPVDYYESNTSDHTKARGKILAHPLVISSYAWFFNYAYSPLCSCLHESQQSDSGAGNRFAFAKAFDITYRWFRCLLNAVKESQN